MKWCSVLVVCTLANVAGAQNVRSKPVDSTTLSGVYTAAQAARGRNVYAGSCRSCHSPAALPRAVEGRGPSADGREPRAEGPEPTAEDREGDVDGARR